MTILHAGGEMGSWTPSDSNCVETTQSGSFNAALVRCGLGVYAGISTATSGPAWAQAPSFWFHTDWWGGDPLNFTGPIIELYDGTTCVLQVICTKTTFSPTNLSFKTLQGFPGTLTAVSGSVNFTTGPSSPETLDIHLVAGASGSVLLCSKGSTVIHATGLNHIGFIGVTKVVLYGMGGVSGARNIYSQCISSTTSTVGKALYTIAVTGNGVTQDWTGAYTDINEIIYNDSNSISSGSAAQVSTYATTINITDEVRAYVVTARAHKGDTGGPQNLQMAVRVSGTIYFSSTLVLGDGFGPEVAIFETNPATGLAWTAVAVNAVQPGVKSIA